MRTTASFVARISVFLLLLCLVPPPSQAASKKEMAKVNVAIDSIRGHDPRTHSEAQSEALDRELDRAWDVLQKHASVSRSVIPTVLDDEAEDSFLLIDLSHLFVVLEEGDPDALDLASQWLLRANPRVYPSGYFAVVSIMGSQRCERCLPAVLKLLELDELHTSIEEHALPVELDLGLLFSIGPYGTGALAPLIEALDDPDCTVRRNAVFVISSLLTPGAVGPIESVATGDECIDARSAAWLALGTMGAPSVPRLIRDRVTSAAIVEKEEQLSMIFGLNQLYFLEDATLLEQFAEHSDLEVAKAATQALEALPEGDENVAGLLANAGSRSDEGRSPAVALLNSAVKDGHFEFSGSAKDLEAVLTKDDLPLVNEARASVLRRATDECLYEYRKLYLTGQLFLQMSMRGK